MEEMIDDIRALTHRRGAEIRLAVFIVVGAIRALLPADEREELAMGLGLELRVLLLGDASPGDPGAFDELGLVDARTMSIVCQLLVASASPSLKALVTQYVAPCLDQHVLGHRGAMELGGFDAFGPATLPAREHHSARAW